MIDTLHYSFDSVTKDEREACVLQLDSEVDWNAEVDGKEPGYESFCMFLTGLVHRLADTHKVRCAFVEGESARRLTSYAQANGLHFSRYQRNSVETLLRQIATIVGYKGNIGSGIVFLPQNMQELKKVFDYPARGNGWLFLAVDGSTHVKWSDLTPFYLAKELGDQGNYILVPDIIFLFYHEVQLCYAEILLDSMKKETVLAHIREVSSSFRLNVVPKP